MARVTQRLDAATQPLAPPTPRWHILVNTLIVAGGTLLSRVLGLVRNAIFSRQFGALPEFGVYQATFSVLDVLYMVIVGGALGSALIPVFSRMLQQDDRERAWKLANTVLTVACAIFVVVAIVVGVFARPILVATVAGGPDYQARPELVDLSVRLLRLMLVQPLLLGVGGLCVALMQSFDRFTLPMIAFNIYNVAIIAAAALLAPRFPDPVAKVQALGWGVVAGAVLYLVVLVPGIRKIGLRFRPSFNWRMPEVRRVGALLAPRMLGQGALQINIVVMIALLGAYLSASTQATFGYAYQLLLLPHGLLAVSLGTVLFPRLTRLFAARQLDDVRDVSVQTLRLVIWLTLPAAALLMALNVPILRLLYEGGKFGPTALALTAQTLLLLAPSGVGLAGTEIMIRTFYAMEETRTPVAVGVATIAINGVLAWVMLQAFPKPGTLALVYSVTNTLEALVLVALLARRLPGYVNRSLVRSLLASLGGTLVMAGTVLALVVVFGDKVPGLVLNAYEPGRDFVGLVLALAALGIVAAGVYVGVGALTRAPEVRQLWALLRRRRAA
jgi:putative peptidoglycan lipid II flippase